MSEYSKITDLTAATALDGTEVAEFVQASTSKQVTAAQIATYALSTIESYSTGWVNNTDWTDAELTVTHNLGYNADDLLIDFNIRTTAGTLIQKLSFGLEEFSTGGVEAGITPIDIDTNSFKIQTGASGVYFMSDAGLGTRLTTESYDYKVNVYYLGI